MPPGGLFLLILYFLIQYGNSELSTKKGSEAKLSDVELKCPEGWSRIGEKCLRAYYLEKSWPQALVTCARYGADLAHLSSPRENEFAANLLARPGRPGNQKEFWIGLMAERRDSGDATFIWSDGTASSRYVGFWATEQPNERDGSCAMAHLEKKDLSWSLNECNLLRSFICEVPVCIKGSFFCAAGGCVPESRHCNGVDDCGDLSDELNCPVSHSDLACLQYDKADSGKISTPKYPASYQANSNCRWVIEGPINSRIKITFDYLESEENIDILTVLDGGPAPNSTAVLASLSGYHSEPISLTSSTNMLILSFNSDATVQARGFQAQWKAVPFSCGGELTAQSYSQSLSSPNYPLQYPHDTECVWTIHTTHGHLITLTIEDVQLGAGDRVVVYDGKTPTAAILAVLSGNSTNSDYVISTSNSVYIYMTSNQMESGRGVSIGYKRGCDISLRQTHGSVISPGNTLIQYPHSTKCVYTIELPDGMTEEPFSMQIDRFDLGSHDHLKIFEGSQKGRALHDGEGFSNERKPQKQLFSRQGRAEIVFESNAVTNGNGFNITYSLNCPVLKPPPLVTLSTKNLAFGTKVTVSCPAGFEFSSGVGHSFNVFCQPGGNWTQSRIPQCQPVYCSAVPQIANGFATSATNVSFGGVAKYSCYAGFSFPSGNEEEEIYCNEDGHWSETPQCKASTCPALAPFMNGERRMEFGDGTGYGTVFHFECRLGYRRVGAATVLCQANGQWSSSQPVCRKLSCTTIPTVPNGKFMIPSPFNFGDVAKVVCDEGFKYDGPDEVRCLSNQTLSTVPSCRDIDECTEGLAQCQNDSTQCINYPGGYTCQCMDGYQPQLVCPSPSLLGASFFSASSVVTSSSVSSSIDWCAASLDPVKALTIHFPTARVVEKMRFESVKVGKTLSVRIRYHEKEGLPLKTLAVGEQQVFDLPLVDEYMLLPYAIEATVLEVSIVTFEEEPCLKVSVVGCQKLACDDVNECMENNGNCEHICVNSQGGYKCECRSGFDLFTEDGQGGVTLEENETGLHPLDVVRFNQSCVARSCSPVTSPDNGLLLSTLHSFHYPIVVQFQCEFGYQMMGPDYLQCLADGSWNGTAPFCLPATCQGVANNSAIGLMVSPDNSTIAYGQNVTIACTQLNRPVHRSPVSSYRQCIFDPQPDGREYWLSGPPADCPLVHCDEPPTLAGADFKGDRSSYQVGSSLEFSCHPPYTLVGESSEGDHTVRCKVDATWDLGDLRCEGPVCVDPGYPVDGDIELDTVEEGAVARFSCNKTGYSPFPSSSIQCMLGAACVLSEDVGISSGFIPDGAFADNSDAANYGYEPHKARLSSTGWCGSKDAFIFLSVDLQRVYTLTTLRMAGVAGTGHLKGHVTKMQLFYKTQFSHNYDTYPVEFETPSGNHNAMHQFELNPPLRARYILLGVAEYEGNPCIRFDMLGCLAPLTLAHDTPSHLQVGWNGSVPQCVDSEPPVFRNCPTSDIFVATDENGHLKPVEYEIPTAEDNSGRVVYTRIEPDGFTPGRPISIDTDVVYTAFDEAGNTAECIVKLRIPDTLPPVMKCPDSYSLAARGAEMKVEFNETTVPMVIQDVSNVTEIVFSPTFAVLSLGDYVEVEVTATDEHSNRNTCKFQVAYMPEPCSSDSLRSAENTLKTCANQDDAVICTVSCVEGYRFVDAENVVSTFMCEDGQWSPSGVAPACVPIAKEPARYELSVAMHYPTNSAVHEQCLQGYSTLVSRSFDELDTVLSQRCSSSVQVFVRFLEASFTNENDMVVGNLTVQILPSVLQDVFYDLCGLTLRTIFDLRIPGATTPVKSLLSLVGASIPSLSVGCPTLTASRSSISQGFGCDEGEVLRQNTTDQLPECLPCPVGSVNANNTCVTCPEGSYQDEKGGVACKACPEGTSTQFEGSYSKKSCRAVCGNGMFSDSGLVPCQLCPRHTFAGAPVKGGYKQCVSCPSGTYTAKLGSSGPSQCKQPCPAGSFSVTGLEPCSLCPTHHYQDSVGQQRCQQCSNETATTGPGAASAESCSPINCSEVKCQNKAECVVRDHRAVCECRPGFVGGRCEKMEDVCGVSPCFNGGECEAVAGTFRCVCSRNYSGARCQFGADECVGVVCPNGGVCHDLPGIGTTKCLCRSGFAGEDCSEITDICSSANPCRNGADCVPSQLGRFKCNCLPGWEGETCEVNIDDCATSPCALNTTCHDLINDFECECPKGFTGKRCNAKDDLCSSNPCEHGICVDTLFQQKCICEEGWTGERCDETINECASDPCKNGATCTQKVGGFSCHCAAGYKGARCQHLVDHCATDPCSNNATCTNLGPSYHCSCPLGFDGVHCEHNTDECKLGKCHVNGTQHCEDGVNAFSCVCKPGYTGTYCDVKVDQCASLPCQNNGSCVDMGASFRCICERGWSGERCEKETGSCDMNPCRNDGKCVRLADDYFCVCPEGVSGKNCELAPNRCLGEPCLNEGVCGDFGSRLECSCTKHFTGLGCQYSSEVCTADSCQNGASCLPTGHGGFQCICPAGFTGDHCDENIDDCSSSPCPLGSSCVDQINGVHCQCPFNMTGTDCEKPIEEDYDLRFLDRLRPAVATQAVPLRVRGKEMSLALWVRFDEKQLQKGTVLSVYNSSQSNYSSNPREVLRVTSEGVDVTLFDVLQLTFPSSQKINNGAWNHLVFTWSSEEGSYSLIWNSIRIFSDVDYGKGETLDMNMIVSLGSLSSPFAGSLTKVYFWNRVLDFEDEIPLLAGSCQGNELFFDGLLLRFSGYVLEGKVERVPRSTCGREIARRREHNEINIDECPSDQFLVTSKREINVSWHEPVFFSKMPLVRVERNLKPGQVFTWGEYDVLYVAFDNSSNSAQCTFKIHVTKEHCPPIEDPVNGIQACEAWGPQLKYKACSIECRNGFEFSRVPSLFYTCASDGKWRPRGFNQLTFTYPQCTKSVPATRVILMRVAYPASSLCSDASKAALRSKLLATVHDIHNKWDICSAADVSGCLGVRIDVECSASDVRRMKREAHSFQVRIELPVKREMVTNSVTGQRLQVADAVQHEILMQKAFNLEKVLPNGRPDMATFQLMDEFHCQPGQIAVGDVCVPCAPGSYYSSASSQCELCAAGTYQPLSGRTQCFACPVGQITADPGSIKEEECKANCPPGHFLDMSTSKCAPCGLGFFQPRGGSFECVACGVGKTTLTDRSTKEEDCRDECPDGEQLSSSGSCQPCAVGTYRTRGENKQCTQCPAGTTTESTSSTRREQCNTPLCKAGQFLVRQSKHCQFCPRGAFQDLEQQTVCKLCPTDHTTAAQGATAESQCYSTNQCTTGEDDCSWHAICIDLPDDNDVPSFQCKCKPGYRGNGTHCYDACNSFCLNDGVCKKNPVGYVECVCKENFSGERCEVRFQPRSQRFTLILTVIGGVVAVLVAIVSVVYMISCRFNRYDDVTPEKTQIEDMPHSNFIYGRPPIAEPPRPIGYYYEDDDEYEAKTMYVTGEEDDREMEQRLRIAQQHMYRPGESHE